MKSFKLLFMLIFLSACASYRPILDENEKYDRVGEAKAEKDIDLCLSKADRYLEKHKSERMRKQAGRSAVGGALIGGALGLVGGGNIRSTAIGAGVGAGVGAASGAIGVASEDNLKPDKIKQRYVAKCLAKKNYEVIGWK